MDQSKVITATPRKFSDELASVYEHIDTYHNQVNAEADRSDSKGSAGIITIIFLIFIMSYGALRFLLPATLGESSDGVRLFMQMMVLFAYVLGAVTILLQYISLRDFYKDLTGQIIGIETDTAKDEAKLFEAFEELSTESIQYAANRLDQASSQLGQLRSFLLGAIDKVGIIPGLVATTFAISKIAHSTGFSWVELLSFLMLGIYISMFPITEASIKTKRISVLLNQYLELFRSNGEIREIPVKHTL